MPFHMGPPRPPLAYLLYSGCARDVAVDGLRAHVALRVPLVRYGVRVHAVRAHVPARACTYAPMHSSTCGAVPKHERAGRSSFALGWRCKSASHVHHARTCTGMYGHEGPPPSVALVEAVRAAGLHVALGVGVHMAQSWAVARLLCRCPPWAPPLWWFLLPPKRRIQHLEPCRQACEMKSS